MIKQSFEKNIKLLKQSHNFEVKSQNVKKKSWNFERKKSNLLDTKITF